jgi:glycosyltransferase involved in cell wall biosynthesis
LNKPRVLIDLSKLTDLYSGLGQVSLNFGKALLNANQDRFRLTFLLPKYAKKYFTGDVDFEYLSLKRRYFPRLSPKYDLWHALHQDSAYMPGSKNTSFLLTIHDLNFLAEKSAAKAKKRLHKLQQKVDRAKAITCISKFTENELKQHIKLSDKTVYTIYNGVEDITLFPKQRPDCLQKNEPFLFAIGVIKEKKNFHVLVDFLAALPKYYKLILAGNNSGPYAKKIQSLIAEKGLQNRFILCGKVSPAERAFLYANCDAFLFPSLHEGFGLPAIEAMQFGKPVFLSTHSSLPEIGGVHAFYWQNFDATYMADFFTESMKYFSDTPNMAIHQAAHADSFSWEKNAEQYLELYQKLLG